MNNAEKTKNFYIKHVAGTKTDGHFLKAPCPFCKSGEDEKKGTLVVNLNPDSFFTGYFRCSVRCTPGGFPLHFARSLGIDPSVAPGYDPDREYFVRDVVYPAASLNPEITNFTDMMDEKRFDYLKEYGVSESVARELQIGFNGRYFVYPYFLENDCCYAARCVLPGSGEQNFWHGNQAFSEKEFRIFNVRDIDRCENGALFITDGEEHLLTIRELGFPGIAVPSAADLDVLTDERLAYIDNIFIAASNTPDAQIQVRSLAMKLGYKVRILKWPYHVERGYGVTHLAREKGREFKIAFTSMMQESKAFSPFSSPEKENREFFEFMEKEKGRDILGLRTGFAKLDAAHNGIRGINIMGGQPKAGKSCFFMQVSTEIARRKIPVIYYDFENGRRKIYLRTVCRLSGFSEKDIRLQNPDDKKSGRLAKVYSVFREMLKYFRVVTDRKLNPEIMRRQIDFLKHETRKDNLLVVIDSLHKLPFKDLSERRTGIDSWLRQMESIRDEQNVSFLVISELSRAGGSYSGTPDMGAFKGSGDIEYSADNAMIFVPDWDAIDPISSKERTSTLWMVASRENSPGKIATYKLDYPYWRFRETG